MDDTPLTKIVIKSSAIMDVTCISVSYFYPILYMCLRHIFDHQSSWDIGSKTNMFCTAQQE